MYLDLIIHLVGVEGDAFCELIILLLHSHECLENYLGGLVVCVFLVEAMDQPI